MGGLHFIGVAGIGMSAIARVMLERGEEVSGSDLHRNALTDALAGDGARIYVGHRAEQVCGASLVIVSSAVPVDNPELVEAHRLGIPVVKRAEFLGRLTAGTSTIAVAGSHGKTTTTAMTALMLTQATLDPSFIVGGVVPELGTNARAGRGPHFIVEADEYDAMFLGLSPSIAVITNVEWDHVDCYPTLDDVQAAFARFARRTVAGGMLLVGADSPGALSVARSVSAGRGAQPVARILTYGFAPDATWRAHELSTLADGGQSFVASHQGRRFGEFRLAVFGRHNVANALAAVAIGQALGLDAALIGAALARFSGVGRRLEVKGETAGVLVIDDYAHHPTEIQATLRSVREHYAGRRIWAVFQPHTYSRTKALFGEFAQAFGDADRVIVTDIYAARERDEGMVSGAALANAVTSCPALHVGRLGDVTEYLSGQVREGDIVVTLSAGDGNRVGEDLLTCLLHRGARDEQ